MLFSWLRQRRRNKIATQPFPLEWEAILRRNFWHGRFLTPPERDKLRRDVQVFVAEKHWEGCNGLELTDEIKVTIAAHACLLVLGFENEYFNHLQSVLVYPDAYLVEVTSHKPHGLEIHGTEARVGEAWYSGPVILAWDSVLHDTQTPEDGRNVVFHEFAHCLDMQDWEFDGTPPLQDSQQYRTWNEVMTAEYRRLVRSARRGDPTLLDHYGATDPSEFFAVATECFFEQPHEMSIEHKSLYELFRDFYRQDPARRVPRLL